MRAVQERFIAKVGVFCDCWNWTSAISRAGYGRFYLDGKARSAHRVAYELFVAPIPDGLEMDHLCHNRRCVNPDHLEAVTPGENQKRSWQRDGRVSVKALWTHCAHGHLFDEGNTHIRPNGRRACKACWRRRRSL